MNIMKRILIYVLVVFLGGCSVKNPMQSNTCEEPVLASVLCSIAVRKKENHRAEVVILYHHTGEYGRLYRIMVSGHGEGRDNVIGNLKPQFAYPGRNKAFIPVGFLPHNDFNGEMYETDFFRVQLAWIDEARNANKIIITEQEFEYSGIWKKKSRK